MMMSRGIIDPENHPNPGFPGAELWDVNADPINSIGGEGNEVTVYGIRINGTNIAISESQFNDITSAASSDFHGGQQLGAAIEHVIANPFETSGAIADMMVNGYADYLYVEGYGAWNALTFMYNVSY